MQVRRLLVVAALVLSLALGSGWIFSQNHFGAKGKVASDADVQKCIVDKLGNSKLKDDSITPKVSGGEATLEGSVKVSAHKGNASQIAKNCGAQKVTNNLTIPPIRQGSPQK
jgi:osmotically-inducible protein OsmY